MTTIDIKTLEASVEALIQQQVVAYGTQLREALGRKFSPRGRGVSSGKMAKSRSAKSGTSTAPRRTPEELEALAERFFVAVESAPGKTMMALAGGLELRAKELERPVLRLKKAGRIKTVGERSFMRYYPMTPRAA